MARRAIRLIDLKNPERLKDKLQTLHALHNHVLTGFLNAQAVSTEQTFDQLMAMAPRLLAMAADVPALLAGAMQSGAKLLFEGAQGTLLDIDHGTYPLSLAATAWPVRLALVRALPQPD